MLKRYRNALLGLVEANGLEPLQFSVSESSLHGKPAFRLTLRDSPLAFTVRPSSETPHRFDLIYTKFTPQFEDSSLIPESDWGEFTIVENAFGYWLTEHVKAFLDEQTEPDLWGELRDANVAGGLIPEPNLDNSAFSDAERLRIEHGLTTLLLEVRQGDLLDRDQTAALHERVDYLIESSQRLGRKDWVSVALGAFVGFAVQSTLTPEVVKNLFHLVREAIHWVSHQPIMLP